LHFERADPGIWMKHLSLLAVLMVAGLGCDLSKYFSNANSADPDAARSSPSPTSRQSPSPSPTAKPAKATSDLISFLIKSDGKYPYEVKLLENAELKDRLKKLLGKDFSAMKAYFDVQAPIEIIDGILMTTGCEAHNCGSNQYLLFVDLKNDNINVFHAGDETTEHYFENGEIRLPKKFADQLSAD
jgi:hypothetical protein